MLTSGLSEAWFSYRDYDAALVATQREAAALAVTRIEQFVDENERALHSAVQPLRVDPTDDPTRRHEDFRRLLRQALALTEVTYLDGHGRERMRVSRIAVDVIGSNVDRSDEPAYRAAQAGGTYYSPVQFRDQSEPLIQIAVGDDGPSAGVTIADLNLKLIWDVVTQISNGETGSAYVVDTAGRLIAHPELELVLRQTDMSGLSQVQSVLRGGQTGATIAPDLLGRQVLSTSAVIPPLGWTAFVEQPLEMVSGGKTSRGQKSAILRACLNCSGYWSRPSWPGCVRARTSYSRTCFCATSSPS